MWGENSQNEQLHPTKVDKADLFHRPRPTRAEVCFLGHPDGGCYHQLPTEHVRLCGVI